MSKRRRLAGVLTVALVAGFLVHLLIVFAPQASAEDSAESPPDETSEQAAAGADESLEDGRSFRSPFSIYTDDVDALSYEELDQSEKDTLDKGALWAETGNGPAVHSRYSVLSRAQGERAREQRAAQLAGIQGLDEVGVQ